MNAPRQEIGRRFREERQRLALSHQRVADLCGVAKTSVIRWEQGTSMPADKLSLLVPHGFDANWIVAGQDHQRVAERKGGYGPEAAVLDHLARLYLSLPETDDRDRLVAVVEAYVRNSVGRGP